MNLKINREPVSFAEQICSCAQEQPIELDYVLPDYYPEIFRIIKCSVSPEITSCAVSGDRATYELVVRIKVIYCADGSILPQAVDQKLTYSRTVELDGSSQDAAVYLRASADNIVCRAANKRRIDIRGSITVKISAVTRRETDVVTEAFGGGIQLKKMTCPCLTGMIRVNKRVTASDELELTADAPPIGSILRARADVLTIEKKLISNRLAAKGELRITLVYAPADSGGEQTEPVCTAQLTLPYSHLTELPGIDDTYECRVSAEAISCELSPRADGSDGDRPRVECEVLMLICCEAAKRSSVDIVCDEYSSSFASSHESVPIKIPLDPADIDSVIIAKGICESKDSPLSVVYDCSCCTDRLSAAVSDGRVCVSGKVRLSVMGRAVNGDLVVCETDAAIEEPIALPSAVTSGADIMLYYPAISCSYTLTAENTAEVKAEIVLRGRIYDHDTVGAITAITVDETSPKEKSGEYALRLYFARNGEEVWDIAKRYGAAIDSVTEENELEGMKLCEDKMLMIPEE